MATEKLETILKQELTERKNRGTLKGREAVISRVQLGHGEDGPRVFLAGYGDKAFLRMNSNSYLGLSTHNEVVRAEEKAVGEFGTGPGAVRFISGTYQTHVDLEKKLAAFHVREAAMIFSAAYAAIMGILPVLINEETVVISDALNHSCIINAIRLSRPATKLIYNHLDMADLEAKLQNAIGSGRRAIVVTDGIFSMRGDSAPLDKLTAICKRYTNDFPEGIITVVDDSHGVGAFGQTGRGTEEYTNAGADLLVATLGKALGVNGGYVAASNTIISYLRESAPFYIYSNPITPAEAAAACASLNILDSSTGTELLNRLRVLTQRFEAGLIKFGFEIIPGEHPIVPLMIRDTAQTAQLVKHLFANGILATGIKYPVVPRGDEEIRFQISATHTEKDIDMVLGVLQKL
ncbi:MAG: pyridoxal phosphate-dependent aminotransferase family protein [Deltaproteobacteria bacterium]|nr:pyridoxal phosphate-dependent aminotransferase family protein [Deltaproteobacteria bacterium]